MAVTRECRAWTMIRRVLILGGAAQEMTDSRAREEEGEAPRG